MKKPPFNPNDFDLPGIRQMIASERVERVSLARVQEFVKSLDECSPAAQRLIAALRTRDPMQVGVYFLTALKSHLYETVTEYDAVARALQLHNDFYSPTNAEEELL